MRKNILRANLVAVIESRNRSGFGREHLSDKVHAKS